jgi:hypothetical protein
MINGMDGPVILDIGRMANARVAVDRFSAVACLLLGIEVILVLAIFPDGRLNLERIVAASIGCFFVGAQIVFLWPGPLRFCREIWRAYGFVVLVIVVFVVASLGMRAGWLYADRREEIEILPLVFVTYSVLLAYPVAAGLRGLLFLRRNIQQPLARGLLLPWLFPGLTKRYRLLQFRRGISRALPWFAVWALACAATLLRIVEWRWLAKVPVPLTILIGSASLVRGLRHLYKAASEARMTDPRAPVLILRAFRDDGIRSSGRDFGKLWRRPATWFRAPSFEELLADEFRNVGPPIIVGAPGERLPRLGASRAYFADKEWREAVGRLIEEAAIVIILIGDTENLFWELRTAVGRRSWDSVILVVPSITKKKKLDARLQAFVSGNSELLGPEIASRLLDQGTLTCAFQEGHWILIQSRKRTTWHYELAIRLLLYLRRESGTDITQLAGLLKNSSLAHS